MGEFVFKWTHPVIESCYVTGTFDAWSKSEKLEKVGNIYEKNVTLPDASKKIYYKFVVDGDWTTDPTAPQENDDSGNLNNFLTPERIIKRSSPTTEVIMSGVTPQSTTAELAKSVPLENTGSTDLPGAFPETPGVETGNLSVNPIPASEGIGNPIKLEAGEKVPDPSEINSNTIASHVTLDKESYENGSSPTPETGTFSVNPIPASDGIGNPITLEAGEKVPDPSEINSNTIASHVKLDRESYENGTSPTPETASFSVNPIPASDGIGNPIKLEAGEKVPDPSEINSNSINSYVTLDKESYENGVSAPVLPPVVTPQNERDQSGTGVWDLPPISGTLIPESSLPMGASGVGTFDATPTIQSVGPMSTTAQLAAAVPLESSKVPEAVDESQKEAGFAPEASAVPGEVQEKSEVEKQLLKEVSEVPATSEGFGAGETAAVEAPTTAAQDTPEVVKESIAESGQSPEAAAYSEPVAEKSQVEKELLSEVKPGESTGESAPKIIETPAPETSKPATAATETTPSTGLNATDSAAAAGKTSPDSRDISPSTVPGTHTQPSPEVAGGVGSSTTASATKANAVGTSAAPTKSKAPKEVETDKKKKRRSFFGQLKDRFTHKKEKATN